MQSNFDIVLIRNTLTDEDGHEHTTYGVKYVDNNRIITVRHLSTRREEVEHFISAVKADGVTGAIDDLLEDFVS